MTYSDQFPIMFASVCLESEANRERKAAGTDPSIPGQCVRRRRPAGGC